MPVLAHTLSNLWGRKRVRLPVRPLGTRLALEALEERTLLSVLPPPLVSNQRAIDIGTGPSASIDPIHPNQLVSVFSNFTADASKVGGQFSTNNGSSWSPFILPANMVDP